MIMKSFCKGEDKKSQYLIQIFFSRIVSNTHISSHRRTTAVILRRLPDKRSWIRSNHNRSTIWLHNKSWLTTKQILNKSLAFGNRGPYHESDFFFFCDEINLPVSTESWLRTWVAFKIRCLRTNWKRSLGIADAYCLDPWLLPAVPFCKKQYHSREITLPTGEYVAKSCCCAITGK